MYFLFQGSEGVFCCIPNRQYILIRDLRLETFFLLFFYKKVFKTDICFLLGFNAMTGKSERVGKTRKNRGLGKSKNEQRHKTSK